MNIIVRGNRLEFTGKTYDCAVGKNGFTLDKKEGDLCCPVGEFELRKILYRADKNPAPESAMPVEAITENEGWCDAPEHPQYNQKVQLPFPASHEKLWRDDDLYDYIVILGHNDSPPEPNKGSAIFMHIAKPNYEGTEGCVALKKDDLLEVLAGVSADTKISISAE